MLCAAPKIITTSPTTDDLDKSAKRRSIFGIPHANSKAPLDRVKSANNNATVLAGRPALPNQSATAPSSVRASHISFDEPQGRLSTASLRSGPVRSHEGVAHGLLPAARLSESSRSEASSGDHVNYNACSRTDASSSTSSFFRIPKLKKNRNILFPFPKFPPQIPKQDHQARELPASSVEQDRELLSPLPSPSRSVAGRATPNPTFTEMNSQRKNSTTSAQSARSSLSLVRRPSRRGRSSTIGSLADIQDDIHHSSPDIAPSSRTSTFTAPRKSFSDLFSPSRGSKYNAEGGADPSGIPPGTPQSATSKQNSFSIAREVANCPPREPDDTPATYLTRLEGAVHRAAVATILSQSAGEFYQTALSNYMRGFSFTGDAMDMSIRKLLMEAELPKETQQIDRVLQSFADRYHECNPNIFSSSGESNPTLSLTTYFTHSASSQIKLISSPSRF